MSSLAAETREAVQTHPFLLDALRAGVVNYSAAAAWLAAEDGLDGDTDAVATALRRFRADLPDRTTETRGASVSMRSGVGLSEPSGDAAETPLFRVGDAAVRQGGDATAILASGDVDAAALAAALGRLSAAGVDPLAAGVAGDSLVVVVGRREGATAVRVVEAALEAVPVGERS